MMADEEDVCVVEKLADDVSVLQESADDVNDVDVKGKVICNRRMFGGWMKL